MAEPSVTVQHYTLVLGGSAGIGFAYAEWCAARKRRLIIVGQQRSKLTRARRELIEAGATEVICRSGNLLDSRFRTRLLAALAKKHLSAMFIGGPTPPTSDAPLPAWRAAQEASEACIVYPVHMLDTVFRGQTSSVEVIFLSSSAAQEEVEQHPFFWSATLRPVAEAALKSLVRERDDVGTTIDVWRPRVVNTELARRYATSLPRCEDNDSLVNRLRQQFHLSQIPTPKEYVMRMMEDRR